MLVIVKRLIHTNEVCLPDAWKNSSKIESRNLFILWIEITIRLTTSLHNIPPGFSQQIQVSKVSDLGQLLKYISNICYISYMVWTLVYRWIEWNTIYEYEITNITIWFSFDCCCWLIKSGGCGPYIGVCGQKFWLGCFHVVTLSANWSKLVDWSLTCNRRFIERSRHWCRCCAWSDRSSCEWCQCK